MADPTDDRPRAASRADDLRLVRLLPIVLVGGGLHEEPPMTCRRFWADGAIRAGLVGRSVEVVEHERPPWPCSWDDEDQAIDRTVSSIGGPVAVVAGSNGCTPALRLAHRRPDLVPRLFLAWPATAGDPVVDELARVVIADRCGDDDAASLLAGEPIRGVSADDAPLAPDVDVVLWPATPEDRLHRRHTVTALAAAVAAPLVLGGSPVPLDDAIAEHLEPLADTLAAFAQVHADD